VNPRIIAVVTGIGFVGAILVTRVASSARTAPVSAPTTAVVRNGLGQLKWVATEATDYTPLEAYGRHTTAERSAMSQPLRKVSRRLRPRAMVFGPAGL